MLQELEGKLAFPPFSFFLPFVVKKTTMASSFSLALQVLKMTMNTCTACCCSTMGYMLEKMMMNSYAMCHCFPMVSKRVTMSHVAHRHLVFFLFLQL